MSPRFSVRLDLIKVFPLTNYLVIYCLRDFLQVKEKDTLLKASLKMGGIGNFSKRSVLVGTTLKSYINYATVIKSAYKHHYV